MKGMPLPFQEKGMLDFLSSPSSFCSADFLPHFNREDLCCYSNNLEPRSVLEASRRPSPPNSSSTLSSSQGPAFTIAGGSATSTDSAGTIISSLATIPAVKGDGSSNPSNVEPGKCGQFYFHGSQLAMEDWESVLSAAGSGGGGGSVGCIGGGGSSSSQEQSILRLIMGEMEEPSLGAHEATAGFGNAGFPMADQVLNFNTIPISSSSPDFPSSASSLNRPGSLNPIYNQNTAAAFAGGFSLGIFPQQQPQFVQFPYNQLEEQHHLQILSPPPPKRIHSSVAGSLTRSELCHTRPYPPLQILHPQQQRAAGFGGGGGHGGDQPLDLLHQQGLIELIYHAAYEIELNHQENAQGILARLNHQLPVVMGKPLHRVAFYFKEALKKLLQSISNNSLTRHQPNTTRFGLVFKLGAYKSFSDMSPIIQFSNFTCTQALLDSFEGFDKLHIIDFDLGFGTQWPSFMQELIFRSGKVPSLKITALAFPSHDEVELGFIQESLYLFAREICLPFELEIMRFDPLNYTNLKALRSQGKEFLAVNLPIVSFINTSSFFSHIVHHLKQLSPKIVVALDRGSDRTDLNFPGFLNQSLQSYTLLLESLDACKVNMDAVQKIERFLIQPGIEKLVMGRHGIVDPSPSWRNMFLQQGFSPVKFSNFAESQADCLVQRTPAQGFQVEKKQASLVLSWQRKELVSVSVWKSQ